MDSYTELCDLIAQRPEQFSEKLLWICGRCPSEQALLGGSPRVSRSQLNAILGVARFLSKCPDYEDERPKSLILAFYRVIPLSFTPSFWPQSFGNDAIASFFSNFLTYMCKATDIGSNFAADVAVYTGNIVTSAMSKTSADIGISRIFLNALSSSFPPILSADADKLVSSLLEWIEIAVPSSPRELLSTVSESASYQSFPCVNRGQLQSDERASPGAESSNASGASSSGASKPADDATNASPSKGSTINGINPGWSVTSFGINDANGIGAVKGTYSSFDGESLESLEKQQIAFELIRQILDKSTVDSKLLEQVRLTAKYQLQSMLAFLKVDVVVLCILWTDEEEGVVRTRAIIKSED